MRASLWSFAVLFLIACGPPRAAIRAAPGHGEPETFAVLHTPPAQAPERAPEQAPDETRPLTFLIEVQDLGLFDDERGEAEEMVAAWAEKEGIPFVPVARARQILERAKRGLHAETGEACGRPLPHFAAKERWQHALGADASLKASLECHDETGACSLRMYGRNHIGWEGDLVLERAAAFSKELPWREALPLALAALEPPPEDEEGPLVGGLGLGGIARGGAGGFRVVAKPERLSFSLWPARAMDVLDKDVRKDGLTFAQGTTPLRACFDEDGGGAELLLEVDERGRVARCEPRGAHDEISLCSCDAFVKHASARKELRSRRVFVGLNFTPADVVTPADGVVTASVRTHLERYTSHFGQRLFRPSVSDSSIREWRPPTEDALKRCFLDMEEPGQRSGAVTVRFDSTGSAVAAEVEPTKRGLSDAQQTCIARVFETVAKAPCPAVDGATTRAEVFVTVRRIGDDLLSPLKPAPKGDAEK